MKHMLENLRSGASFESSESRKIEEHNEEIEAIRRKAKAEKELVYDEEGKFTHAIAPNGERSSLEERQYLEVRSSTFKEWFGGDWEEGEGSVTLDENGEPRVFYHTTSAEDFTEFKGSPSRGGKIWFSPSPTSYVEFAKSGRDVQPTVLPIFLKILNPGPEEGNDGFIQIFKHGEDEDGSMSLPSEITVNDPKQIKSATKNNGLYSMETANIYE